MQVVAVMEISAYYSLFALYPHFSVMLDIFTRNQINHVLFFHCYSSSDIIVLQKAFYNNGFRITTLQSNNTKPYSRLNDKLKLGILMDTSCTDWAVVFKELISNFESKSQSKWLLFTTNILTTKHVLSLFHFEINPDVMIIYKNRTNWYDLYEAYKTQSSNGEMFVLRQIGFWNTTLHIRKSEKINLNGLKLNCVSVITQNLVNQTYKRFLEESRKTKTDTLHKLKFFTIIGYLQDMFNFSVNVQRTNSWGYSHNGSFDGLIGALQRRETDIGCSPVLFRINRVDVVDYIIPTWQTRHCFLFRQPKYIGAYYTVYTEPLDISVWRCILAVLVVTGVILTIVLFKLRRMNIFDDEKDTSLSSVWLFICGAICQQGMPTNRKMISSRILILVTFFFTMIIHQFYSGNILSSLLNEKYNKIRDLKDLLDSDLNVGVEDMPFNKDYFKRTTDSISLALYHKKIATDTHYNFFGTERGMKLVKFGNFAFHVDTSAAYRIMRKMFSDQEICEISEVPLFPPQYVGAVTKKGSPYREFIAIGISKSLESGIMKRIESVWDVPKPPCEKIRYRSVLAVTAQEIFTPLLLLAFGLLASVIILVCEIFIKNLQYKKYDVKFTRNQCFKQICVNVSKVKVNRKKTTFKN